MLNFLTNTQDFLSDTYFMKSSFKRYCRNKGIKTSEIKDETKIGSA